MDKQYKPGDRFTIKEDRKWYIRTNAETINNRDLAYFPMTLVGLEENSNRTYEFIHANKQKSYGSLEDIENRLILLEKLIQVNEIKPRFALIFSE